MGVRKAAATKRAGTPKPRRRSAAGPRTATKVQPKKARAAATRTASVIAILRAGSHTFPSSPNAKGKIRQLASEWSYTLRMRSRWTNDPDSRALMGERAVDELASLGFDEAALTRLAQASRIEVELFDSIGAEPEDTVASRASDFPWEYVLSAATRFLGRTSPVLITRLLRHKVPRAPGPLPVKELLVITSAPGRIWDVYEFDTEVTRLRYAVGTKRDDICFPPQETAPAPTLDDIRARMRPARSRAAPAVVHVTGVDPHQACGLIAGFYDELGTDTDDAPIADDGILLAGTTRAEEPVSAADFAAAVVPPGAAAPRLVTLNLYYSAARTARAMVRQGADAAIGFQDAISDEIAEYFFTAFFWECRDAKSSSDVPWAFERAWKRLTDQGHDLHGTGIVLWLGAPVAKEST